MAQTTEVEPKQQRVVERKPIQLQSARRIALRVLIDALAVMIALFGASIVRFEILDSNPAL